VNGTPRITFGKCVWQSDRRSVRGQQRPIAFVFFQFGYLKPAR
jgi:hypothetical protein